MSPDLVSIIIPCYRQGRFLTASVTSALGQSHAAVEVIVVDDGSDDDTGEVAKSFGDRIRYLRQQNAGPTAARNTGARAARGKYLLFLDADDILHYDAVACLVEASCGREDVLCTIGARDFSWDEDLESGRVHLPPSPASAFDLLIENFNPPFAFLCSRTRLLAAGGCLPCPEARVCEDWAMWTRLLMTGVRIVPVARIGGYYRQHPTSRSKSAMLLAWGRIAVMSRTMHWLKADPAMFTRLGVDSIQLKRELVRQIAREYLDLAYHLRESGKYFQALHHYILGIFWGGPVSKSLFGICKLLPHRIWRNCPATR